MVKRENEKQTKSLSRHPIRALKSKKAVKDSSERESSTLLKVKLTKSKRKRVTYEEKAKTNTTA